MRRWHSSVEFNRQALSIAAVRIDGWRQPVGHQGFQTAAKSPFIEGCRIIQESGNECFVIAFEENDLSAIRAFHQEVNGQSGIGTSIEIIAKADNDGAARRMTLVVHFDLKQEFLQQTGAAVDISNRVDADIVGERGPSSKPGG